MTMLHPSQVYVPIMGFTQDTSRVTGIEKIWRELRKHSSSKTWVFPPQVWNADWKSLAHLIANNASACVEIVVVAYSWGAGHGFVSLAKELAKYGLKVVCAYLADPVYRSPRLLMRWRSLVNRGPLAPTIHIPDNVKEVRWTRQSRNKPQGHDLQGLSPEFVESVHFDLSPGGDAPRTRRIREQVGTLIHDPVLVDCDHAWMDDRQEFRNMVLEHVNG